MASKAIELRQGVRLAGAAHRFGLSLRRPDHHQVIQSTCVALVLGLVVWFSPHAVGFKKVAAPDIFQLLTIVVVIAAFLERALEVFIDTWRGPGAAALKHDVMCARRALTQVAGRPGADGPDTERVKALNRKEHTLRDYRCQTQQLAMSLALTIGLLISAAGVRALEVFTDPAHFAHLPPLQTAMFHGMDVLLTGGLIAGGSAGIHKLATVYNSFMETTGRQAKRGPRRSPAGSSTKRTDA